MSYIPFSDFLFRTPTLPVSTFFREIEKLEENAEYWAAFLQNSLLQEAIFLASPVLYDEIEKYLSGYLTKEKDIEKLKNAVLRYFSRMCSRCTPFGLFAGFSLGCFNHKEHEDISQRTQILLPSLSKYCRYTRLDMHYLCALAQDIGTSEEVRKNVKYYPNSSIYVFGNKLRYVEYYYKKSKRIHQISSVDFSEYLEKILEITKTGLYFAEIIINVMHIFSEENIEATEVIDFIKELIENQVLVSELEPEITGKDFLFQIHRVLHEVFRSARNDQQTYVKEYAAAQILNKNELLTAAASLPSQSNVILSEAKNLEQSTQSPILSEAKNLEILAALLTKMDTQPLGKSIELYKEAEEIVKTNGTAYEKNYLFQVDMFKPVENAVIDNKIADEILEAIGLMNQITTPYRDTTLKKIADSFYERYEEREMPLLQVLDVESGIGYPANKGDISPMLEGYAFPNNETSQNSIVFNRIQSVLHKKLIENYRNNGHTVEFTEKDFDFLTPNWDDLPQTFSCMCEIFCNETSKSHISHLTSQISHLTSQIYIHSTGGSSAANMLGRFCHVDKELEEYVKEITAFEASQNPDKIYAEIVHLPESRLGNILLRPVLREYEIPYLAKASVPIGKQISLSDLFISVRQGKIVLRSQRLNKEIVPRLSTAHNYSRNAMPVYHFLCDLQTQGIRGGVGFSWGSLASEFEFLPRATYKNTILSLATWKIKTEDFKKLIEKQPDTDVKKNINQWREEKKIPKLVLLTEGDNELLIDFDNILCIKMLFSAIKKRPSFELKEFLFDIHNSVVKDDLGNPFTNEFIITFKKHADDADYQDSHR